MTLFQEQIEPGFTLKGSRTNCKKKLLCVKAPKTCAYHDDVIMTVKSYSSYTPLHLARDPCMYFGHFIYDMQDDDVILTLILHCRHTNQVTSFFQGDDCVTHARGTWIYIWKVISFDTFISTERPSSLVYTERTVLNTLLT